jgi:lipid II:glycine glycyltransferase (peptidoglycan interpeptide bridge formation enzyme)
MHSLLKHGIPDELGRESCLCSVSEAVVDPAWDAFLAGLESGHHVQSSLWSQVKAINGWTTRRIIISRNDQMVGGAQLLVRNARYLGRIGYIPKGPVLATDEEEIAVQLLEEIRRLAVAERLRVLFMQPPAFGSVVNRSAEFGFSPCPVETAPSATVLIDLTADLEEILARMSKGMRNAIRRSQKRGIVVREGTREDLAAFHRLLSMTGQRVGFSPFELDYFQGMWDILEPEGCMQVFVGELDGEPVNAQVCVPFGDTVVAKQIGWSGEHSRLHPNEALDWFTIQWAKAKGYRYYDLEGIKRPAAQAIVSGQPLPEKYAESPTAFKLRFGGEVQLYPGAYCLISNPILRALYSRGGYQFANSSIFQKAIEQFRTG